LRALAGFFCGSAQHFFQQTGLNNFRELGGTLPMGVNSQTQIIAEVKQTKIMARVSPVCPLCGSSQARALFAQRGYSLRACGVCELFFIDPYPRDTERQHELVATHAYEDFQLLEAAKHYQYEVNFYRNYFELIQQECVQATSILDVGCGCGHLLERLAVRPDLYRAGVELNRQRAAQARRVAHCEVFDIPIEDFPATRRFDVITLINVFSHIPGIDRLFEKLRLLLNDNGKIILRTGEMRKDVRKSAIFDWEIPDHLQFLGLNTLEFLAHKHGFEIQLRRRTALSKELFALGTWRMKGRSVVRNRIKSMVARISFALPLMEQCYDLVHRSSVFSSFIVLRVEDSLSGLQTSDRQSAASQALTLAGNDGQSSSRSSEFGN
jgi:SAM-dependent methyltransferase